MPQKKLLHRRSSFLLLTGAVITISLLALGLHQALKQPKAVSGPIKTIDGQSESPAKKSNTVAEQNSSINQKPTTVNPVSPNNELSAPYGSFVSNHKPGQNGSNLTELSQCTTTPGATCLIKFTQGDVVKTLSPKLTASDGTVFWEWNVKDAGLTDGKWVVSAVAMLSDQSKTTTDAIELEIQ
ncbi:MAG: hypothetical protein QFB86_02890 [Patescibacteria group bacterium]|nr:hypothetical protein [Patescibacteria group bacterium]